MADARLVYFAYPIDQATGKTWSGIVHMQRRLRRAGWNIFEPGSGFDAPHPDPRIQEINFEALQRADGLFVYWTGDATTGVPVEVGFAIGNSCPMVIYTAPGVDLPGVLQGVPHSDTVSDALKILEAQMDGTLLVPHLEPGVRQGVLWEDCEPIECEVGTFERTLQVAGTGALPSRGYKGDAGFDLYVSQDTVLGAGLFTNVPAGISVALPEDVWALIVGRSSTFFKRGLMVNSAVIDQGYRGPLFACVYNPGPQDQVAAYGERMAQMIPIPLLAPSIVLERTEDLPSSDRNSAGFGSTGH